MFNFDNFPFEKANHKTQENKLSVEDLLDKTNIQLTKTEFGDTETILKSNQSSTLQNLASSNPLVDLDGIDGKFIGQGGGICIEMDIDLPDVEQSQDCYQYQNNGQMTQVVAKAFAESQA